MRLTKILLIDEPELGLNPFAKQEFLKWFEIENRIGIFHLAGDNWELVSTVMGV
ncbi:MAG: hypothetical protein ACXQTS_07685 [Candidatus Methanospirareceae archaeon]